MSKLSVNIVLVQHGFWVCVCVCELDLLCFACPMHTGRKWLNAAGGYCMVVQCTVLGWGLVVVRREGGRVR